MAWGETKVVQTVVVWALKRAAGWDAEWAWKRGVAWARRSVAHLVAVMVSRRVHELGLVKA